MNTTDQKVVIMLCSKLFNLFKEVFDANVKRKITKGQASDAIKILQTYQKNKSSIPEGISDYKPDWRS